MKNFEDYENEDYENESVESEGSEGSEFNDDELVGSSRHRGVALKRAIARAMAGRGRSGGAVYPGGTPNFYGHGNHRGGLGLSTFLPFPYNLAAGAVGLGHKRRGRKAHGGAFFDDFMTGFNSVMKPGMAVLKPFMALAGPEGMAAAAAASALGYGKRGRKAHHRGGMKISQFLPFPANVIGSMAGLGHHKRRNHKRGGFGLNDIMGLVNQGQNIFNQAKPVVSGLKPFLPMLGEYGNQAHGLLSSIGLGHRRRRGRGGSRLIGAGGAIDGRTARASVVREVMAERGLTLPQASKVVKEEGLY